jgi:hypothetical protein
MERWTNFQGHNFGGARIDNFTERAMDVEIGSPAAPYGGLGGPTQGSPGEEDRTFVDLLDRRGGRERKLRIAADPIEPLPPEELAALLHQLLEGAGLEARFYPWLEAAPDVFLAPTLRATPSALKPLGLAHRAAELNRVAIESARRAAKGTGRAPMIAAQMGLLGPSSSPEVYFPFDEAYIHYHEQVKGIALGRPDLVVVRQMAGLRLLRAALVALRECWSGPVVVLLDAARLDGETGSCGEEDPLGMASEVAASLRLQGIGAEAVGDPALLERTLTALKDLRLPLLAAALPEGPEPAPRLRSLVNLGVNIAFLRGAAGLRALESFENRTAAAAETGGRASPPSEKPYSPPRAQGGLRKERKLLVALESPWENEPASPGAAPSRERAALPRDRQAFTSLQILAQNEGLSAEGMRRRQLEERVWSIERAERCPLVLVVRDPLVLETGLKSAAGRSLAYLDSLDSSLWESVFYLASKYGARLGLKLAPLPSSEGGGEVCVPAIQRLFEAAREYSLIAPEDLYIDPLGLDPKGEPAWDRGAVDGVLREMPWAKRETGIRWILNCRHFLSEAGGPSPAFQSEILSIALFQGLDAVILSPEQTHLVAALKAHRGWK